MLTGELHRDYKVSFGGYKQKEKEYLIVLEEYKSGILAYGLTAIRIFAT